jgi:hypothetical protein
MIKRKSRITAGELMKQLQADPEYLARQKVKEEARNKRTAELGVAEAPLVKALHDVGVRVKDGVWDLVSTKANYDAAIPVLFEHLEKDYPDEILDGIARALAVPAARGGWDKLVEQYLRQPDRPGKLSAKQGLAVALINIATEEDWDQIIELMRDPRNGESRGIFLFFVKKRRRLQKAKDIIEEFRHDPLFAKEIASWRELKPLKIKSKQPKRALH